MITVFSSVCLCVFVCVCHWHARWRQVGVLMFESSVQSKSSPVFVVSQQRIQGVLLLQTGARGNRVTAETHTQTHTQKLNLICRFFFLRINISGWTLLGVLKHHLLIWIYTLICVHRLKIKSPLINSVHGNNNASCDLQNRRAEGVLRLY